MNRNFHPAGCTGKVRYASSHDAAFAMKSVLNRSGKKHGTKTTVYFCEVCKSHHDGRGREERPPGARPIRHFISSEKTA